MVDNFLENDGYQLSIRVADYEAEINLMELENPTWTVSDLEAQNQRRLEDKKKQEEERKAAAQKSLDFMTNLLKGVNPDAHNLLYKPPMDNFADGTGDVTDNYFKNISGN